MNRKPVPALLTLSLLVLVASPSCLLAQQTEHSADVVIYGGTSAGIAAAVQVKRMGKSVIVVGPDQHLGGLTSGGLGWTDSGNKSVVGGISREFYQRVRKVYDQPQTWKWQAAEDYGRYRPGDDAQWTFEPHIAERVFEDLVRDYEIPVFRGRWLDRDRGVVKNQGRIQSITMLSGETFQGKMFLDATYEGDLLAAAGVSYTVGRESNDQYGETLNGVQIKNAVHHQFKNPVDPYVVPGDPTSGLLPRIHGDGPGKQGSGDKRVQAYNYRVCLTRHPDNRVPFAKPAGYDPGQYELLLRDLLAGSRHIKGKFDMLPNLKTDTNNSGSFSTDNIGMNYDYPDASYQRRQEILREHETYQQGYFYFLANDPRVPEDVRQRMGAWGLAKDEFLDNDHWPHQIYVREARRMVSDFVVTEGHLTGKLPTPRSVGMGSYNMDSHHTQRYVDEHGHARNEGDVQINPGGPYPIDYGALVPPRDECENLLVPVCVSCTHIAFGSIRMEPVFMVLGQSAATAACLAIDADQAVQAVDYDRLQAKLLADNQVLEFVKQTKSGIQTDKLDGVVRDDDQLDDKQGWTTSTSKTPFIGQGYRHDGNARKGELSATFSTSLAEPGWYEVRMAYTADPNRATNVPVKIQHADGESNVVVNQQLKPKISGVFHSLGTFRFTPGQPALVTIENRNTDGYVIIDGLQWLPSKAPQ